MINGSRGPMLRKATPSTGSAIRSTDRLHALHGERNFDEMLAHYEEYTDVVGDSFLNLVATTLPLDAYLVTGEAKYKKWIVEYMDAWLERMKQNNGIIPSFVDLDGRIGGPDGQVVGQRLRLGIQPGQSRDRHGARTATAFRARSSASTTRCWSPATRNTSTPGGP